MRYTNTILAFLNGIKYINLDVFNHYSNIDAYNSNKINKIGDLAEFYIKDLYCDSVFINNINDKNKEYKKYFSFLGGKNTPPDAIVRNGEAVEIKKQENLSFGDIALNSSHPADYLYNDSELLNKECKNCEPGWIKKNMVYTVLNFEPKKKELKSVWFVFGNCFAAEREQYQRVKNAIREAILKLEELHLKETNELGKVFNIDEQCITNLRIRGMWNMSHPEKIFKDNIVYNNNENPKTIFKLIILEDDFKQIDKFTLEKLNKAIEDKVVKKSNIHIPNPNNKKDKLSAIFLHN